MTICGEIDCEGCITKYAKDISLCKAHGKTKDKNKIFLELVKEHPDYPIIPKVDSDIVTDDYGWYYSNFGFAYIGEFLDYYDINEKCYDDRDDFIEDWSDAHCEDEGYKNMTDFEFDKVAKDVCNKQAWKKVIFVNISPLEGV